MNERTNGRTEYLREKANRRAHVRWNATMKRSEMASPSAKRQKTPVTPATLAGRNLSQKLSLDTPPAAPRPKTTMTTSTSRESTNENVVIGTPPMFPMNAPTTGGSARKKRGREKNSKRLANPCLSVEEEIVLLRHYYRLIHPICKVNDLSHKVFGTAAMYYKRFYVSHTVMDDDPLYMLATSIFLACKVEEEDGGGGSLGMAHKIADSCDDGGDTLDPRVMLKMEMRMMLGLRCDLVVHHPYRCLSQLIRIVFERLRTSKTKATDNNVDDAERAFRTKAMEVVRDLYATDAPLLYTPSEFAVAACHVASEAFPSLATAVVDALRGYVSRALRDESAVENLTRITKDVKTMYDKAQENVTGKILKRLKRRLGRCRNPLYDPTSEEYRQRELEIEEEHRAQKGLQRMRQSEESALLGIPLIDPI